MKLIPTVDFGIIESWRFKKHNVTGVITKNRKTGMYQYEITHETFVEKREGFLTLEDAKSVAENKINLWYSVQGKLLAIK
ncbi:hypothetical protein [Bacillus piscicola]|uniref:hypothetical protein n=1 Tax=Bacillus piscicola TaxID=1632684 RepID=UPI001F0997BE|nr:hypothetical protein [Bacillus piscicola]